MFGGMKCEDDVGGVPELRGWWWWTLGKAKREGGKSQTMKQRFLFEREGPDIKTAWDVRRWGSSLEKSGKQLAVTGRKEQSANASLSEKRRKKRVQAHDVVRLVASL